MFDTPNPSETLWSDRLAFEIALRLEGSGEPLEDIAHRHNISTNRLLEICSDRVFEKKVKEYREDIQERGLTFRLKARTQAEALLATSWILIHDPQTSAAVKADLIKSTVKWAGLEVKTDAAMVAEGASGGVKIIINLDKATDPKVIEGASVPVSGGLELEQSD